MINNVNEESHSMTTENETSFTLCNNHTITNIKEAAIQLYYYDNMDIVKMRISYPYPHPQYDIMMNKQDSHSRKPFWLINSSH
jgi:hypothetical protein